MTVARKQFGTANAAYNGSTATFTSLAVSLPAAATAGSVLVAAWTVDKAGGAFTVPTGWTSLLSRSGTSVSLYVVYKVAAGGETSVTGTWASAMLGAGAIVAEYTGANTTTPFGPNDLSTYSDTATTSKAFAPSTPTSDGDALVIMGIDTVSTSTGFNIASTGYTLVSSSTYSVGSGSPGLALSEKATTSGTANTPTFTWTDSDQVNGVLLQLNVASSGALVSDTFTGTSGAAWPAQWSKAASTSGTATIASTGTSGQIVLAAAHPTDAREDIAGVSVPQVCDIYVDLQAASTGSYVTVSWGDLSGSDARSGNGFETVLYFNGASSKISIGQFVGGAETKPATDVVVTTASSTWYTLHLQYDGTNLRTKFYTQGAAEPGTWTISGAMPTPASLPTTGKISLGAFQGSTTSRTTGYDNLSVTAPTTQTVTGQTATLTGTGALSGDGASALTQTTDLSGSGSLSSASTPAVAIPAALAGAGGLTVGTPVPALAAAVGLSGSGALSGSGTPAARPSVALTGSGSLSRLSAPAVAVTVALAGAGGLSGGTVVGMVGTVSLSGSGTLTQSAVPGASVTPALSGSGGLSAASANFFTGTPALSGLGSLSRVSAPTVAVTVALAGAGGLSGSVLAKPAATVGLSGSGALGSTSTEAFVVAVPLSGSGTLTGVPIAGAKSTTALTGLGALAASTASGGASTAGLSGSGSLAGGGLPGFAKAVGLSGSGVLASGVHSGFAKAVGLSGSGSLSGSGLPGHRATAALTGLGALSASAVQGYLGTPVLVGSGSLGLRIVVIGDIEAEVVGSATSPLAASFSTAYLVGGSNGSPLAVSAASPPLTVTATTSPITVGGTL